jgi:4-hydroxythreonine-4-phosphate dehydrogenase
MTKPILAVTVGDPAGIGPEIALKSLLHGEVYEKCVPILIADAPVLQRTKDILNSPLTLREITDPSEAVGEPGVVDYMATGVIQDESYSIGQVSALCGDAGFSYVEKGIRLALDKQVHGVVTGPINKEAINLAGHHYSGHTEIFADYTGCHDYAMLLMSKTLRVIHVTTHVSMRDACDLIQKDRVLRVIRLAVEALREIGMSGAPIAVAGLNAHSGENGLFGREELDEIIPAIEAAKAEGINVDGPVPPDTVFVKAVSGRYAIVVCMYHDQGHIPLKLSGFKMDPATGLFTSVSGINCTVGLPVIRTSVDHGTAFDRAGQGTANEESLLDALDMAVVMAHAREDIAL